MDAAMQLLQSVFLEAFNAKKITVCCSNYLDWKEISVKTCVILYADSYRIQVFDRTWRECVAHMNV